MDTTTVILVVVAFVIGVVYMQRRRARLSHEEEKVGSEDPRRRVTCGGGRARGLRPVGGRSALEIARGGFVPKAVLRTNPAVAAVSHEVNAVASRHAPRRSQSCLLRAVVR